MDAHEVDALLRVDVTAHLATLDRQGFPHVTPLWFLWEDGAFHLTSFGDRPHLRRLERDPRAGICVDIECPEREDGERPNQQVRGAGQAELFPDEGGYWTRRISTKYIHRSAAGLRATEPRTVIRLRPIKIVAVKSI